MFQIFLVAVPEFIRNIQQAWNWDLRNLWRWTVLLLSLEHITEVRPGYIIKTTAAIQFTKLRKFAKNIKCDMRNVKQNTRRIIKFGPVLGLLRVRRPNIVSCMVYIGPIFIFCLVSPYSEPTTVQTAFSSPQSSTSKTLILAKQVKE